MATDRLVGHDLARYHVEAILGRGGMGVVYRAVDTRLGRTVALKVLSGDRAADPEFRERFLRESRLLASIDHPNIVPIFEADETDDVLYIAMRFIPGPELRQIIIDEGPMDAARTVAIIAQVADALDAAHAAGLVHRDVKPGNVLVMPGMSRDAPGYAYLMDFGLTKSTGSDTGLTKMGQFVGTPGYIAPEQIEGGKVDHRADIYALGCILFNCLSGDVPYPRDSTVASLWAHLKEPPPKLSDHRKGLPKGLDAVITKALAKAPDQRFQTCGALAAAARAALGPIRRPRRPASRPVGPLQDAAVAVAAPIAATAQTIVTPPPMAAVAPDPATTIVPDPAPPTNPDPAPMVATIAPMAAAVADPAPTVLTPAPMPAVVADPAPTVDTPKPVLADGRAAGATVAPSTVLESPPGLGAETDGVTAPVPHSASPRAAPTVFEDAAVPAKPGPSPKTVGRPDRAAAAGREAATVRVAARAAPITPTFRTRDAERTTISDVRSALLGGGDAADVGATIVGRHIVLFFVLIAVAGLLIGVVWDVVIRGPVGVVPPV